MAVKQAMQKQDGGGHYKDLRIQPVEFIYWNQIPFIEGCVIKYVCRHRHKNKVEDLRKAIHFLEMLIELEYADGNSERPSMRTEEVDAAIRKMRPFTPSLIDLLP